MNADAIFRVTKALRDAARSRPRDAGDPGTVFVGPLDDPDANGASLILFLYRIMPNASLRNREHRVPSDNPPPPCCRLQRIRCRSICITSSPSARARDRARSRC